MRDTIMNEQYFKDFIAEEEEGLGNHSLKFALRPCIGQSLLTGLTS